MNNICPVCQKDDAIQRVVAVVQAGQASGLYSGPSGGVTHTDGKWGTVSGYTTLSGSTTSNLARLLAPPPEPQKKGLGFLFWGMIFLVIVMNWLYGTYHIITLLAIASSIIFFFQANREKVQSETRYASEKPAWDTAMEKWNRLYFCHRDGKVFDPENSDTCEPSQIRELIYK